MKFFVCLALTALVAVAQGVRNPTQKVLFDALVRGKTPANTLRNDGHRIIGGEDATLGQFPWQGSLQYFFFGHICGLSILSENFVVTAAHCVEAVGEDPNSISVKVGITNLNDRGQEVDVKAIYKHEDYDNTKIINDIAILELATPLQLNENVQAITIGVGRTPVADENGCRISGWGSTDANGFFYPDDLQWLDVTFYDDAKCAEMWAADPEAYYTDDVHLCAGTESGDNACFGDSGGPIVCETVEGGAFLFGATSFGGNVCGKPEWPDVWTELPFFIDWIEDKTGPLPRP
jgi:secreted trypsin-like serine protease